mmetsp:Transcript_5435/g.7564  ORF Transcript_5435/g.7564 Transcript_5435/m.7564 type:complete len:289 (-) Transcript_5435:526-1392(-)
MRDRNSLSDIPSPASMNPPMAPTSPSRRRFAASGASCCNSVPSGAEVDPGPRTIGRKFPSIWRMLTPPLPPDGPDMPCSIGPIALKIPESPGCCDCDRGADPLLPRPPLPPRPLPCPIDARIGPIICMIGAILGIPRPLPEPRPRPLPGPPAEPRIPPSMLDRSIGGPCPAGAALAEGVPVDEAFECEASANLVSVSTFPPAAPLPLAPLSMEETMGPICANMGPICDIMAFMSICWLFVEALWLAWVARFAEELFASDPVDVEGCVDAACALSAWTGAVAVVIVEEV